ncbi:sporulation protein rmd1 [Tilletia horrida]|uniref:Sporulation protein rmd1 n=1 Tax=Tilletia horrida TaxID=155126 RepID=A0AAN6GQU2_9BASI|nr:sporulation protein rmd1 [Tilletia horrida]KAK0549472.1 sporulation protein rmd1 [Tilletia horrida]KAK0568934.1 sporulation protein rmd1 [Tilletia horrida]
MAPSIDSTRRRFTGNSGGQSSSSNSNYQYSSLPRHGGGSGSGPGSRGGDTSRGPGLPSFYARGSQPKPKAGPNRTTKASGKLKILPEEPEEGSMTDPPPRPQQKHHQQLPPPTHTPIEALRRKPYPYPSPRTAADHDEDDDDDDKTSSEGDDDIDEAEQDEYRARLYQQLAQIPEGNMRRDARRLTRKARASLPRVTAYSTATSYRMRELTKWLQARRDTHQTNVMSFDECVYTTYSYALVDVSRQAQLGNHSSHRHGSGMNGPAVLPSSNGRKSLSAGSGVKTGDLLGVPELHNRAEAEAVAKASAGQPQALSQWEASANASDNAAATIAAAANARYEDGQDGHGRSNEVDSADQRADGTAAALAVASLSNRKRSKEDRFSVHGNIPEVFFMEYGTVVIWGMTLAEEKRLLRELKKFEVEKLAPEDIESEDLNWYLADYSRIYNDVITLRRGSSYMTKLSLSHALAQSTKISFFEGVIDNTIDSTKDIPQSIAESGKIGMPPAEIMKQIGHLFILRMNIHLVGSIVDSPEIFWSQPDLEPLYSAARSYLEIPQRIDLLNARVEVLQDMLQLLKDQVTSSHSEWLEIIVIVLIVLEIILGVATMLVDLFFA